MNIKFMCIALCIIIKYVYICGISAPILMEVLDSNMRGILLY